MSHGPRLSLEELAPYLLEGRVTRGEGREQTGVDSGSPLAPHHSPLDWPAVFGNHHRVELEVGFGKGLFLITSAVAQPAVNFVGIEIVRKYQLFTATRLAKRGLRNVRVACADVRAFLPNCVRAASVHTVHVYFPDPWWKTRHHKRRVFTVAFVQEVLRVLVPDGVLSAATDVPEYAVVMRELLDAQPALRELPPPAEHSPGHDLDYLTNFERKFRKQGKPIHRLRYHKIGHERTTP